jgi:hypothetical protein
VPQPEGFAFLGQEIYADDYRGATVVFGGQVRTQEAAGRGGVFMRIMRPQDRRGPFTEEAVLADPRNHIVMASHRGWDRLEASAPVPDGTNTIVFGTFLAGPGRIELHDAELTRAMTT